MASEDAHEYHSDLLYTGLFGVSIHTTKINQVSVCVWCVLVKEMKLKLKSNEWEFYSKNSAHWTGRFNNKYKIRNRIEGRQHDNTRTTNIVYCEERNEKSNVWKRAERKMIKTGHEKVIFIRNGWEIGEQEFLLFFFFFFFRSHWKCKS